MVNVETFLIGLGLSEATRLGGEFNADQLAKIDRPCQEGKNKTGYPSKCRPDGLWEPKQCDERGCFCVNPLNGEIDITTVTGPSGSLTCAEMCLGGDWSKWFNTDDPATLTGELRRGDLETLDRARLESKRLCEAPIGFKVGLASTRSSIDLENTPGLVVEYEGPTMGVRCYPNDSSCEDYIIKFCCPLNSVCHWSEWSNWSSCSSTCGAKGIRHRERNELFKPNDIDECPGKDYEVEDCGSDTCCAEECEWSAWGEWSECSSGCHGGARTRNREKVKEESCGGSCSGRPQQEETCLPDCGVYGVWNGEGCTCDAGWFGQCCREEAVFGNSEMSADDAGAFSFQDRFSGRFPSRPFSSQLISANLDEEVSDDLPKIGGTFLSDRSSAAENETCQKLMKREAPRNGQLTCQRHRQTSSIACTVTCNPGHDFVEKPAHKYFCHPSGVVFTNPPGRSLDWPDCTRKHSTKGQRSDIYMEYALEDGDNCEENLHELKRAFKEQNTKKIVGEPLPGFNFFTRVRMRCGRKEEVLKAAQNEDQRPISTLISARSSGAASFSLPSQDSPRLVSKEDLRREKKKANRKSRRQERRNERKNRTRRSVDNSRVFVELRVLQFAQQATPSTTFNVPAFLRSHFNAMNSTLLDLRSQKRDNNKEKLLARLQLAEIVEEPVEEDRCLNGEVKRIHENEEICVACPAGTYQKSSQCLPCPAGQFNPKEARTSCRRCPPGFEPTVTGGKSLTDCYW